jgi:hypothetical protein
VFSTIRDDEAEHVKTMAACQDPEVMVRSPNIEAALAATAAAAAIAEALVTSLPEGSTSALVALVEELAENGISML